MEQELDARATASILALLAHRGLIGADLVDPAVGDAGDEPLAALALCGLSPVAKVDKTRHTREVVAGELTVASLSVDEIRLSRGDATQRQLEIEIEAKSPSGRHVVERVAHGLKHMYPGVAEPTKLSKLERAFSLPCNCADG